MQCPKAGALVFLGLVLMTAGFVLTLAGWFAPPINEAVLRVRLAGPVTLLVGLALLAISCCLCAFQQRKCCSCCYPGAPGHSADIEHTQMSPLLLREMRQAMDRCGASTSTAAGGPGGEGRPTQATHRHGDNKGFNATTNRSSASSLRPANIIMPRAGIYQQTYCNYDCGSPGRNRKAKVTVKALPAAKSQCPLRPSPASPVGGALPPEYYTDFKKVVDSAL